MDATAQQAELDQLQASRDELAVRLDTASAVITGLDEQIRGDGPDPTITERKAAHDEYQAAFAPWNEVDGQIKVLEQQLAGETPGPDQGIAMGEET